MQILVGWSGETANANWRRVDLTLDETDFRRLCLEYGIPVESIQDAPVSKIFGLLEIEAQRLLMAELIMRFPSTFKTDENMALLQEYGVGKDKAVARILDWL